MEKLNFKQIILGLCFSMAATVPTYAQWSFGIKAGINSSTVSIKNWDNKQKIGFLAGGVVTYQLSEHFDLQGSCSMPTAATRQTSTLKFPTRIPTTGSSPCRILTCRCY